MSINLLWFNLREILFNIYEEPKDAAINTLSLMVTSLLLAGNVQLPALAMWAPLDAQITSIVRRFERFLSNPKISVREYFAPFVLAMHISLGSSVAYLVIDCTKSGPGCRTLFIGIWYHATVLPVVWRTIQGSKGHVTGQIQKILFEEVYPQFKEHNDVIVLGDAEFSNQTLIQWLLKVDWGFVFRFQSSYHVRPEQSSEFLSARDLANQYDLKPGDLHYVKVAFTKKHKIENLAIILYWEEGYNDPIFLVTNLPSTQPPHIIYKKRFAIETLFSQFKSRAFNLAVTHIYYP